MPERSKIAPFCRTVGVGLAPPAHDAPTSPHIERRQRKMPVGVDAALSPAAHNRRIVRIFGENEKRPVGADDPVRPLGNRGFAATFRNNGRASCGSMRRPQASFEAQPRAARLLAPKMGIDPYKHGTVSHWCIRICGCVPPGGQSHPPLRVRCKYAKNRHRACPVPVPYFSYFATSPPVVSISFLTNLTDFIASSSVAISSGCSPLMPSMKYFSSL